MSQHFYRTGGIKALEKVSEMESKQYVFKGQPLTSTRMKPEKFVGSGNNTDVQKFLE